MGGFRERMSKDHKELDYLLALYYTFQLGIKAIVYSFSFLFSTISFVIILLRYCFSSILSLSLFRVFFFLASFYKIKRVLGVLAATFGGLRRCFTQPQHALIASFTCISANSNPTKIHDPHPSPFPVSHFQQHHPN